MRLRLFLIGLFVLVAFVLTPRVAAQSCNGPIYCDGPCNTLWYTCSCSAQLCQEYTFCDGNPGQTCDSGPYASCCQQTMCSDQGAISATCPFLPCINICGPNPTPTNTPGPTSTPIVGTCGFGGCQPALGESCSNCSGDCGVCPTSPPPPPPPPPTSTVGPGTPPPPPPTSTPLPTAVPTIATCVAGVCNIPLGQNCANCPAGCGPCPTATPSPTPLNAVFRARSKLVSNTAFSCADVAASTSYVTPVTFSLNPPGVPVNQTQTDSNYVGWTVPAGAKTLSQSPPSEYTLKNACWTRTSTLPLTGAGLSATAGNGETLTWELGYSIGPWLQTGGGDVVTGGILDTNLPNIGTDFNLDADGFPGVVIYGSGFDFTSGAGSGVSQTSSRDWLTQHPPSTCVNYYDVYYQKLGSPTTDTYTGGAKPGASGSYYQIGDLTTSANWVVPANQKITILVNGNLSIRNDITITTGGFLAFIVSGNITIDPSVGVNPNAANPPPVLEGLYMTNCTSTFSTGASSSAGNERLVARGTFVTGSFLFQRDIGANNPARSAELFTYSPDLFMAMPEDLKDVPVVWEEVAP